MLNYLWSGMILLGVLWGCCHGQLAVVTEGALKAAGEAVSLCIAMAGVMSLWTGILEVGKRAGLIDWLSVGLKPFLKFLFPRLPADSEAARQISVNIIANMLGLGWAATPAGLKAMEELKKREKQRGRERQRMRESEGSDAPALSEDTASDEMCTFLILNISSLQLIPMNMIAYRSQYKSAAPAAIVGPALAATAVSTGVAVVFCRVMDRRQNGKNKV